jgi:hypothetical protein
LAPGAADSYGGQSAEDTHEGVCSLRLKGVLCKGHVTLGSLRETLRLTCSCMQDSQEI